MSDGMTGERVSVRIGTELRSRLQRRARREGKRESDIVREALSGYLETADGSENCYALAQRIGVIGSVKTAPPDLSTNRRHFEGFGA